MQLAGIGRVVFWEGGSLWLALIIGGNERHVHHAVQISLPLDGVVRFQQSQDGEWVSYAGAVIAPDLPHAFQAPGRVVANILFEPESAAGRAMFARFGSGITALSVSEAAALVAPLAAAYFGEATDAELIAVARRAIAQIARAAVPAAITDPRVLKAIVHIRNHIDEPIRLETLAREVGLSPGRFRHLFASETGVSCKAFVLWERLNRALALGFGGTSWTEAAHAANFADSAHLSRTCRRMFGLAPTGGRIERPEISGGLTA
jgi:AraC-like DNA-binding protein